MVGDRYVAATNVACQESNRRPFGWLTIDTVAGDRRSSNAERDLFVHVMCRGIMPCTSSRSSG